MNIFLENPICYAKFVGRQNEQLLFCMLRKTAMHFFAVQILGVICYLFINSNEMLAT